MGNDMDNSPFFKFRHRFAMPRLQFETLQGVKVRLKKNQVELPVHSDLLY